MKKLIAIFALFAIVNNSNAQTTKTTTSDAIAHKIHQLADKINSKEKTKWPKCQNIDQVSNFCYFTDKRDGSMVIRDGLKLIAINTKVDTINVSFIENNWQRILIFEELKKKANFRSLKYDTPSSASFDSTQTSMEMTGQYVDGKWSYKDFSDNIDFWNKIIEKK